MGHGAKKRRDKTLGYTEVPLAVREKVKGKREFVFTSMHRVMPQAQLDTYRADRTNNPVPNDKITVKQAAGIFGITETEVLRWIHRGVRELGDKKLSADRGPLLCPYKKKRPGQQERRERCWHVSKEEAKIIWNTRYPGKSWPLKESNADRVPASTKAGEPPTPAVPAPKAAGHSRRDKASSKKKEGERKQKATPEREKHLKWQEWKKDLCYSQIVQRGFDETGDVYSVDAIKKALARLPE